MAKNTNAKPEMTIGDYLSEEQLERIRRRAYEFYEARGRAEGHDLEDWLQAEAEIAATKDRAAKA